MAIGQQMALNMALNMKDNASKTLDGVQKKMGGFGKAIKGLGIVAGVGGVAIAGIGTAIAKMALDAAPMENVRKAFAGISGDADAMMAALRRGSSGMVRQTDLMKSYNSAAQLVSKTFADQLPGAMGYLSKVAGATGEDMGFMIDSLVKGVGRMSPMILDNLGIQVTLADAVARASEMFGVEASELTKAQQQAGMMNVVMEKLAENTAAMPEIAGTLNQRMAAMKVQFADTKQAIGEAFIPVALTLAEKIMPLVSGALEKVVPFAEKVATWLGEKIPLAIEAGSEFFEKARQTFDNLREALVGFAEKAGAALEPYLEKVKEVFGIVQEWLGTNIPAALEWLRSTWETIWPILQTAIGIWWEGVKLYFQLVIDYWTLIWEGLKFLWSKFQEAWPAIKQTILDAWAAIQPKLQELQRWFVEELIPKLQELWQQFQDAWPGIKQAVADAWDVIKEKFQEIRRWIVEELIPKIKDLWDRFVEAWPAIKQAVADAWATIKEKFAEIKAFIVEELIPKVKELWDKFVEAWPGIQKSVQDAWDKVKVIFEKIKEWIVDTLIPKVKELWDQFKEAWPGIKKSVADAWKNIRLKFVALKTWIVVTLIPKLKELWDKAKEVWAGIEKAVSDAWEGFRPHLKTLKEVLGTFTTDVLPKLQTAWDTIVEALEPVIEAFKSEGTESGDLMKKIGDFMGSAAVLGLSLLFDAIALAADAVTGAINGMKAAIEGAKGVIESIKGAIDGLKNKLSNIKLPDWLTPGSATPFELGLRGISSALSQVVPLLGKMEEAIPEHEKVGKLAQSFNSLISSFAGITGSVGKTLANLTGFEKKAGAFGAMGLEGLRDWLVDKVIPIVRGIHAALKQLPLLDEKELISESLAIWAKRYQAIASILNAVNAVVKVLVAKSEGFKRGAPKGLENIRDAVTKYIIPVVRGIHAAFKNLPLLDTEEVIASSLAIWAKRYQAISSILGSVNTAVEILSNKSDAFKTGAVKGLVAIRDAVTKYVIPVVRGIHAAFKNLPLLDEKEIISESLKIWAARYQGISSILNSVNAAVEMLTHKSDVFKTGAVKGLVAIRDAVTKYVIPVIRGIHAAFKNLPLLDEKEVIANSLKIWAARYGAISSILNGVNSAVEMLTNKSKRFKTGAAKGLIAIRDAITKNVIPIIRGLHAAFKNLPLLDPSEIISKSLKIWAERYSAISSILGGVNTAVEMLINKSDRFKTAAAKGLIAIRDAILKNVIPVVRGIHAAFKELPLLDTDEVIAASLKIWAERYGAISTILDSINSVVNMLIGKSDAFKTAAAKGLIAIRDAVTENVIPVIRGIHAALKNLPVLDEAEVISKSLKIWAERLSAGVGIITDTMAIADAALQEYVSPDLSKIELIATDAVNVIDKVELAINAFWTNADKMIARAKKIADVKAMVGDVATTITDTINVAKGLSEMSWREVKQHQVDSFTRNLANIVKWLTDPQSGIAAITGLTNMGAYKTAAISLGTIVTEVVEAVREVMTLPAIWDDRLNLVSNGLATFLETVSGVLRGAMAMIGRDIYEGLAAVLNDGVFFQLGLRNANAYEAGWEFGMDIHSPSGVARNLGHMIREGFEQGLQGMGAGQTNEYHLHVSTNAPREPIIDDFNMLRAMGGA